MKLHHLADDIFGSKSKVRILRLLSRFPEREFTEREIARLISMSQNTVNIALHDLMKTNVLNYQKIGRANAFIVNKESVIFSFITRIFKDEKAIRGDMIKRLKKATSAFVSSILFGSFAENTEGYDSDLDLLVITKDKRKAKDTLAKLELDMLREYNVPLSIVLLTPRELINKLNAPYMKQIRKNHLRIGGKTLEELYGEIDKNPGS